MSDDTKAFILGLIFGAVISAAFITLHYENKYMQALQQQCKAKGGEFIDSRCLRVEEIK